jgi:putative endonuclease
MGSDYTKKYKTIDLLYYEHYQYVNDAIGREKQIKRWSREKKLKLIYIENPKLESLNQQLFDDYQVTKNDVLEIVNILKEKYLEQV